MNRTYFTILFILFFRCSLSEADTFRHKTQEISYTGYAKQSSHRIHTVVTLEKGAVELDLSEYDVEYNSEGRSSYISVISIDDELKYDFEGSAITDAILAEADKGPLFILIELDTPGGRVDLARQICGTIIGLTYCKTVAYVKGEKNGGAYSAGAAIAMACDKLYMVPGTSIGAATMMAVTESGIVDMKEAYGDVLGEKFDSAWRTYLASLAQENNRPGALAKAMADKNIVVVEVKRNDQTLFIENNQQSPTDNLIRTVCRKGELLTMAADDAVLYQFADGTAKSRHDILTQLGHRGIQVLENKDLADAREQFEKVLRKFDRLNENLDLKFKEMMAKSKNGPLRRKEAIRDFDKLLKNAEYVLKLKRSYPDIPISEDTILEAVNSIKAKYKSIKSMR